MSARTTRIMLLIIKPNILSTGDQIVDCVSTRCNRSKPRSTTRDGEVVEPNPLALLAIRCSESMICSANVGPLVSSHQKNPVINVKERNSPRNSPISARRSANCPIVHTKDIVARVQNSQLARARMYGPHPAAAV